MLTAPPKVNDVLIYGEFDRLNPPYRGMSTFIVESIDTNGNYILRLNSMAVSKRRVSMRYFIKKSRDKKTVNDATLAQNYSDATEMLKYELETVMSNYKDFTGVTL